MRYAKLINETTVEFPPVYQDGISNYHLDDERLKQDGYLELIDAPYPNDGKNYAVKYLVVNKKIEKFWVEMIEPAKDYAQLRIMEYPPIAEYLDAQVKINSGDEALIAEGKAQEQTYFDACLAVKAKYPKPTLNQGGAENE